MKDRVRDDEKKQIEIFRRIRRENPVRTAMEPSRIICIPLGRANAYLGIGEGRVLPIDTGVKGNEQKILQALGNLGLPPSGIRLIILTHTHYDHCGKVAQEARLA